MISIKPLEKCDASIPIPGSKSFTHRALIVSALAEGESFLENALRSEDIDYTASGLIQFGVPVCRENGILHVVGKGGRLGGDEVKINLGNSGTSMRFLTGLAALRSGRTSLDGSARMRNRPIEPLLQSLRELGIQAYSREGNGCPPVMVDSRGLRGGSARVDGRQSSQFLSALLMIAPLAQMDVLLRIEGHLASKPYVDITLRVMADFGVKARFEGGHFFVPRGQRYLPRRYAIEGDASNASYFLAAAAVTMGKVRVRGFHPDSVQGDAGFLGILEKMGCAVTRGEDWAEVRGAELAGIEVEMNTMPDLVPTLAVTAAFARGKTVIRNIGHLRFKESDRIAAVARELLRMGAKVEEGQDWLAVEGGPLHGAEIETYDDHRMAMAFAVAGLAVPGVRIKGETCVAKSFPNFWETLQKLYAETPRGLPAPRH